MDQIKIGKFIAEERKAKKYTQREVCVKYSLALFLFFFMSSLFPL